MATSMKMRAKCALDQTSRRTCPNDRSRLVCEWSRCFFSFTALCAQTLSQLILRGADPADLLRGGHAVWHPTKADETAGSMMCETHSHSHHGFDVLRSVFCFCAVDQFVSRCTAAQVASSGSHGALHEPLLRLLHQQGYCIESAVECHNKAQAGEQHLN